MISTAPLIRQKSKLSVPASKNFSLFCINDLSHYLNFVNNTLVECNLKINNDSLIALKKLRKTLIQLEVNQIKQAAISQQIWDFYPTNNPVIDKMLQIAQLQPNHKVLEPSAGAGDLAKEIANKGVSEIDCFELHPPLQKALKIQDFNVIGDNFLISTPRPIYDRVIANPPFGSNGVARHTQHAFKFLKPGGKLISLSHHYLLKPSQTDKAFFAWLKQNNARFLNCGRAFQNSDRSTNVPLQIISITKS